MTGRDLQALREALEALERAERILQRRGFDVPALRLSTGEAVKAAGRGRAFVSEALWIAETELFDVEASERAREARAARER